MATVEWPLAFGAAALHCLRRLVTAGKRRKSLACRPYVTSLPIHGPIVVAGMRFMRKSCAPASLSTLGRTDQPRRETLRRELARIKTTETEGAARPTLVLASASPRRLRLLAQVGVEPDALRPATIDESARRGEMPRAYVARVARAKAETARDQIANDKDIAGAYVLAADTAVALGRRIIMKPSNIEEAANCLQLLSGRAHRVLTSVHIRPL